MLRTWFTRFEPSPDTFAVVMATGILSIAAAFHQYWRLSVALCIAALAAFGVLGLAFFIWLVSSWPRVVTLLRDPDVVLRLFTFVAACAVLGVRFDAHPLAVLVLGSLGLAAWFVLAAVAAVEIGTRPPRDLRDLVRGGWLLPSVATVGLAITTANLAIFARARWLLVSATGTLILGVVVYLAVICLIVWRVLAKPITTGEIMPELDPNGRTRDHGVGGRPHCYRSAYTERLR